MQETQKAPAEQHEQHVLTAPLSTTSVATRSRTLADSVPTTFGGKVDRKAGSVELRMPTLKARRAADRR